VKNDKPTICISGKSALCRLTGQQICERMDERNQQSSVLNTMRAITSYFSGIPYPQAVQLFTVESTKNLGSFK
jgi:hypothetical protein